MTSFNVLILSTADDGGAGVAAYKLSKLFLKMGHNPKLLVVRSTRRDAFIDCISAKNNFLSRAINKLWHFYFGFFDDIPDYYFFDKDERYSFATAASIGKHLKGFRPDLIIAGWASGFVNFKTLARLSLRYKAPAYFWLADMGALTGGCHYAWECLGYTASCNKCPALSNSFFKTAAANLKTRNKYVKYGNLRVIAGSQWVAKQAKSSQLFAHQDKILTTNCMVDRSIYTPVFLSSSAKIKMKIDPGFKVMFFAATSLSEKRKGVKFFYECVQSLLNLLAADHLDKLFVLLAGKDDFKISHFLTNLGVRHQSLGFLHDERQLSLAYQASDVYVSTSIQDSGPMMIGDALACGTPVISFDIGLASDVIVNGYNGKVVDVGDSLNMALALEEFLFATVTSSKAFRKNAFETAKAFCSESFAQNILQGLLP